MDDDRMETDKQYIYKYINIYVHSNGDKLSKRNLSIPNFLFC